MNSTTAHNTYIETRHVVVFNRLKLWRFIMWTKPAATEMRFGFEVTMYVMNK